MGVKFRRDKWYIRFWIDKSEILMPTDAGGKREAQAIEHAVKSAIKTGDYLHLDNQARDVCVRLFQNKGWEMPQSLVTTASGGILEPLRKDDLTLLKAIELFLKYPETQQSPNLRRYKESFMHVVEKLGPNTNVHDIWIPEIKMYQIARFNERAAAGTINKERSALSKMFQVLIELALIDRNPVRMVKALSESDGEREVYISHEDFTNIVDHLPAWMQPIVLTLYYTGMRRGEALGMKWENVNLETRIIRLDSDQTKERKKKRVPIHKRLVPILERIGKVRSISHDYVFIINGCRPPNQYSLRKCWIHAAKAAGLKSVPTIHDLRHVWSTNAMRSGLDFRISETIMGHALKRKNIAGRYLAISDSDLVREIDKMEFDQGSTEIWVARKKQAK
jgi:integrase